MNQRKDVIYITDLMVRGIIGVNDWERRHKQDILINLMIYTDLRRAGETDEIDDTCNYRSMTKQVIQLVETSSRFTVEALATDIARLCLANSGCCRVRVRVEKPGAVRFSRTVGVEIDRVRHDFDG